jgi:hypothetical protein
MKLAWTLSMVLISALAGVFLFVGCSDDDDDPTALPAVSSRSYQGHATDADINAFVNEYRSTVGTRLDDCQTCHKGDVVLDDEQDQVRANPCDYCHFIIHPREGWTGQPESFGETLNAYGVDYAAAGRNAAAIAAIAGLDSDDDGFANAAEIADLSYPGNAGSYPGLPVCPVVTVTMAELRAMPAHTQFGLANTNKQQFDFYANYTGVKIKDLLESVGVDLAGATSIDILAPDGYASGFTLEQITEQFPTHRFYPGFGTAELGVDCGFVEYPAETHGYVYGEQIADEQWHLLAYAREGVALEPSYLDPASGKINGEGPLRSVIPPGSSDDALNQPDRGKNWDTSGCTLHEWDYLSAKDHNAGAMVKGAVILRINPMPAGCEEFDIINGGWAMVDAEQILIYGHGVDAQ